MEATEGVSSATLATLLIITLALGWKYNSLATRSINTTQVFFLKGPMCCKKCATAVEELLQSFVQRDCFLVFFLFSF